MDWWVYKCNSKKLPHQKAWGDWNDFFQGDPNEDWGCTQDVRGLEKLKKGDMIIAYQTDRKELVGIAQVRKPCQYNGCVYLDPIETIGAKLPPLKKSDPKIAAIPAFKRGPLQAIREISEADVKRLLKKTGSTYPFGTKPAASTDDNISKATSTGVWFGETENNKKVEKAAISFITRRYEKRGWSVQSVEGQKRGFDLICRKGNKEKHIEVKGISGNTCSFIITIGEVKKAESDPKFAIWAVTEALSKTPKPFRFTGKELLQQFSFEPVQFKATLKSSLS